MLKSFCAERAQENKEHQELIDAFINFENSGFLDEMRIYTNGGPDKTQSLRD